MKIFAGYEVNSAKEVSIPLGHLVVTGMTNLSGKTTTLEALINRSGLKAVVFRTKVGEKSFLNGTIIPPFFRERSDWVYIKALVEAIMNIKISRDEQAFIIKNCKKAGDKSLTTFKKVIDERLSDPKCRSYEENILTNIQTYLELVLPKLNSINFSLELKLSEGINIIDLERFAADTAVQSLIIESVLSEILYNPKHKDTVIVVPESWKFLPERMGNPCKRMAEEYIRQGAQSKKFMWLDSQDIAGVSKTILKQVSVWIMGNQPESNEVKHTIAQIPLPKKRKARSR